MRKTIIYFFILMAFGVQGQNIWQAPNSSQRLADDQWRDMETTRIELNLIRLNKDFVRGIWERKKTVFLERADPKSTGQPPSRFVAKWI